MPGFELAVLLAVAAAPTRFDPPQPELGDPFVLYVSSDDPAALTGSAEVFGYQFALFRVDDAQLRGLAAVPVDVAPGSYPLSVEIGRRRLKTEVVIRPRTFRESELSVDPKFTKKKKPEALKKRIRKERKSWKKMLAPDPTRPQFHGGFQRPAEGERTSEFGVRRVFNGQMKSQHYGLDLDGEVGDPIVAVQAGRVVMSEDRYYSGGTIVIDHGNGLLTAYFHMSKRLKKKGAAVKSGERLGDIGKSGRVTGPHLHLSALIRMVELRDSNPRPRGLYVDPERLLALDLIGSPRFLSPRKPR